MTAFTRLLLLLIFPACCLVVSCNPQHGNSLPEKARTDTLSPSETLTIAVQPFDEFDTALVSLSCREITDFFGFFTTVLPAVSLPESSWYAPRSRYRADSLLIWLENHKPSQVRCILGLTDKDISCTNGDIADWGIFGYGYQPGPSCVVSTFRLKRNAASDAHFRERFAKVLLHELGHNIGLHHCTSPRCLMGDAEGTINTVDHEQKSLCPVCCNRLAKSGIYPLICK